MYNKSMDNFLSVIRGIDFSKFSDSLNVGPVTLFAGLILVFLLIYGLSLGRTKALMSLLGIYIALAFDAAFPYLEKLHGWIGMTEEIYSTRILVFVLVYLAVFVILNGSFAKRRLALHETSMISVGIVTLTQIGLLVAIITNIIPSDAINNMPEYLSAYFGNREALFYWIVIPILALVFLKKSKRRGR